MLNLIPKVKELKINRGFLKSKAIRFNKSNLDHRLLVALETLPQKLFGTKLEINISGNYGESYELYINEKSILINAESVAGAFYGIQTLKQRL